MKSAVAVSISSQARSVVLLGDDRHSVSAKYIGCGCCHVRSELISPGAERPVGSVILPQRAPS